MKNIFLIFLLLSPFSHAQRGVFLTHDDFFKQAFPEIAVNNSSADDTNTAVTVVSETYWFTDDSRKAAEKIIQRKLPLRIRYYKVENINPANTRTAWLRTAWILEEIGKELPITVGIVVNQGKLDLVRVLEYREVRGGEVRYDFFTQQFMNATLDTNSLKLDKSIDGISGATLSVQALTKVATLALFLDQQLKNEQKNLAQ